MIGIITNNNESLNNELYNFFLIIETGFTLNMYYNLIRTHVKATNLIVCIALVLMALYVLEIIQHSFYNFNNITTTVMSVIFVDLGLFYYLLLMKADNYIKLNFYPPFWWVVGTLFFYYGSTASNLFFTIFKAHKSELLFQYRHLVFVLLNLIQYGFWSYSFICRYYQRKSIHSYSS